MCFYCSSCAGCVFLFFLSPEVPVGKCQPNLPLASILQMLFVVRVSHCSGMSSFHNFLSPINLWRHNSDAHCRQIYFEMKNPVKYIPFIKRQVSTHGAICSKCSCYISLLSWRSFSILKVEISLLQPGTRIRI